MQKQFKYIYNNEEVSREDFERLAGDSFKWFDGDSVVSVPFSSFDSFFSGDYRSNRQINDHLKEVLDLEKLVDKSIESRFNSILNFSSRERQKNTNSTRHKSQVGETHKETVVDLEGINRPPSIYNLHDNQNYYTSKALETLNNQSAERHNIMNSDENIKKHSIQLEEKDDTITNSNRGEKETMEHLQGVKESQSVDKAPIFTYCKVNKNALEALAFRALYGHKKYNKNGEDEDWQNFTRVPNAEEEYANAEFRHALEIGGEETTEEHLIASAWNAVSRLEIFLREKSK